MLNTYVGSNNLLKEYLEQSELIEQYCKAHTDFHIDSYFKDGECDQNGNSIVHHADSHHDF